MPGLFSLVFKDMGPFIKNLLRSALSFKIFLLGILIGALGVAFYVYQTKYAISGLFDDMFVEQISYRFHSYATKVSGKQSLHVARLQQMEVYERTSRAQAWSVRLPDVVVSAEFPVEYNYSVSLVNPWRFERNQDELVVHVPELSSQAPAVNVSEIRFNIKKGSILRSENDAKEKLRKELNTFVIDNSIVMRDKVRDQARESIRQFLQTWVAQTTGQEFNKNIRVVFPNETKETAP